MLLLPLLALGQSAFAAPPPTSWDGQCLYPPGLGAPAPLEARATCNRVVSDADGIEFQDTNWPDKTLRFSGEWKDERLTVHTVVPRNGEAVEARGLCRIYYKTQKTSMVACTAIAGARSWVGNFQVSRTID